MKALVLTTKAGHTVWVNADFIVQMTRSSDGGTLIMMVNASLIVKESISMIRSLLQ